MPALAEDGTAVLLADLPGGGLHPGGVGDEQAGKDLGLRDVGRDDLCQREYRLREGLHGVVPRQGREPEVATITGSTTMCFGLE